MSKPIHLLVLSSGPTEAYYQLSKEEQDAFWAKVEEIDNRAGANWLIACNSRWANEEIYNWAVIEYPSMETYQQKVREMEELQLWRYWSAKTVLGMKTEE